MDSKQENDSKSETKAVELPEVPQYPPIVTKPAHDPIWQKFSTGWGKEQSFDFIDDPDIPLAVKIVRVTGFSGGPLDKVILGFAEKNIVMVEWETHLFRRYRAPYVVRDPVYLIPDDRLDDACKVCKQVGLESSPNGRKIDMSSPTLAKGRRTFIINREFWFSYLKLIPLSWTGLSIEDTIPVVSKPDVIPDIYRTLPVHTVLAALARLAGREKRYELIHDLTLIASHYLFDLNYVTPVIGEPPVYKEHTDSDSQNALRTIESWDWKNEDIWVKEMLCSWTLYNTTDENLLSICEKHVENRIV